MEQLINVIWKFAIKKSKMDSISLFNTIIRVLLLFNFLGEGLISFDKEQKRNNIFFMLILMGSSLLILAVKKITRRLEKQLLVIVCCGEFVAYIEMVMLESNKDLSPISVFSFWKLMNLVLLSKFHGIAISSVMAEFFLRSITLLYFILRVVRIANQWEICSICFAFTFIFLDFIKEQDQEIDKKRNKQKMNKMSREAQLSSFLIKNCQNNIIIDPSLLASKKDSIYKSFLSIVRKSSSKDDNHFPINLFREGSDTFLDVIEEDPESLRLFFLNFSIEETDQETYKERGPSFEALLVRISHEILVSKGHSTKIPMHREIVRGRGCLRSLGTNKELKEMVIEFIIYNFYEDNDINKPLLFLIIKDKTINQENKKLKQFDAYKDRMLATVVHDMRAPLSLILGSIERVANTADLEEIKEALKMCEINSKYLEVLVSDILDFSLFKEKKLNLICSNFSMQPILEECMNLIRLQADYKSIQLKIENQFPAEEMFYTDQRRLKQVVINLLTNAIKFTRSGSITLSAEHDLFDNNRVLITVTDTGSGIKRENIPQLGGAYATFDIAEGLNKYGIGLGLFISKTIITHLGPLDNFIINSEENKGTAFSFYIYKVMKKGDNLSVSGGYERNPTIISPTKNLRNRTSLDKIILEKKIEIGADLNSFELEDETKFPDISMKYSGNLGKNPFGTSKIKISDCHVSVPIGNSDTNQKLLWNSGSHSGLSSPLDISQLKKLGVLRVLAVDDNIFNAIVLESLLKKVGKGKIAVEKAGDGGHAVEAFKKNNQKGSSSPFHIIFMDCLMPIMDGMAATKIIKSLSRSEEGGGYHRVVIAGLTALQCTEKEREECFQSGMDFIFQKPISELTLREFLKTHL